MSLTVEQLLEKRYIVTAPVPFKLLSNIGDIFIRSSANINDFYNNLFGYISEEELERCTGNFRLLFWWEYRQESDLPEYLKTKTNEGWIFDNITPSNYLDKSFMRWKFGGRTLSEFEPATEQEYNDFKNKIV